MDDPEVCIDKLDLLPEGTVERMALLHGKLWGDVTDGVVQPGPTPLPLKVAFLDGSTALQKKVIRAACEWMEYAHIEFFFGEPADVSEIRISFRAGDGSWSYVGTDALGIPKAKPTMNYGWLTEGSDDV